MKKMHLLTAALFAGVSLAAQKGKDSDLPAFGRIEKSDLEMKACPFDDKAEAFVLIDNADLTYIYGSGAEMKRRVRIKILSDKGLDQANVHLRFRSEKNLQDITGLEAQTYNLDAGGNIVVTKLDKKLIFEKKLDKKNTEKVFSFPEVKVGSIIEYKFKKTGTGLVDWFFQQSVPVRLSRFSLDFPNDIEVNVGKFAQRAIKTDESSTSTRLTRAYSMTDIPAFRDEPYIVNEDFYRDRLVTKIVAWQENGQRRNNVANWVQCVKYLMEDEDFGVQIKKNVPRTADLDEELKKLPNPYERMKAVFHYVQKNMQWNDYTGIWALDGIKSAWKDKKGTAGEINLILINLLKDAGLKVHPILVSTHDNGIVNQLDAGTYDFPGFYQFNKVLAYVEINKKAYVLDATDKVTPAHLIPADVLLTDGLVIEKIETSDWGWKTLYSDNSVAKNVILVRGIVAESGKMEGEAIVTSYDYARLNKARIAKSGKEKFIERYVTEPNPGINVDDLAFENLESDSLPLVQTIKFNQNLNASGEYQYFSANMLSGLESNPFVADTRFSDIFFGVNQSYLLMGNYTLPEGYELEALPKNLRMIMPDTSITFSRLTQLSGNTVMTKIQVEFKKPVYAADIYPELQEFYKRLQDILNEQFVIRKKLKA